MIDRVAVVGPGRLGACLLRALCKAGVKVQAVAGRDGARTRQLAAALGLEHAVTNLDGVTECADCVFLTVPDAELPGLSAALLVGPGQSVIHCSGALDHTPLTAAGAAGAQLGVFHPLQAFAAGAGPDRFNGIALGVDAQPPLFERLCALAAALGAEPFSLAGVDRAGYHAAAVFAGNYVVALHAAAGRIWQAAGLPAASARRALVTLSRGSVENLATSELAAALTGPIARGDATTISRHLGALPDAASRELYRALGRELLQLPLGHPPEMLAALQHALGSLGIEPGP